MTFELCKSLGHSDVKTTMIYTHMCSTVVGAVFAVRLIRSDGVKPTLTNGWK